MWSHINIGKTINNLRLILHVINMVLHEILVTSWYEKKKATHFNIWEEWTYNMYVACRRVNI